MQFCTGNNRKMSYSAWLNKIKTASKTSVIQGKVRKVHYKFTDGQEMAEEYSMETGVVIRRAWKYEKPLTGGPEPEWIIELGDVVRQLNDDTFLVKESITAVRKHN